MIIDTYAAPFDEENLSKEGLTFKKLSQKIQGIWSGRREDWCLRCKLLSRTGPGSNQRPTTYPSPGPRLPQCHRIFSHYSGADRWASLCISAMHFLKSEKPIHLGQTHKKEGEKEKLQNSFFFSLLASTRLSFTSFQSTPSLIVSGFHICHVPWRQPKLRRNGTLVVPHCTILRVDKFTKIIGGWDIAQKGEKMCFCFLIDWINLSLSGTLLFRHSSKVVYLHMLSNRIQAFSGQDK